MRNYQTGKKETVALLIERGAAIDGANNAGCTPLCKAVEVSD